MRAALMGAVQVERETVEAERETENYNQNQGTQLKQLTLQAAAERNEELGKK